MKIRAAFAVLAVLWMIPAAWSQASSTATAAAKVGVINIQAAIAGTAEGKQAAAELQSQFAPRTTELQNLQKQIQDLGARVQNGQTTLSDEEKVRLQRQYEQSSRLFSGSSRNFRTIRTTRSKRW